MIQANEITIRTVRTSNTPQATPANVVPLAVVQKDAPTKAKNAAQADGCCTGDIWCDWCGGICTPGCC